MIEQGYIVSVSNAQLAVFLTKLRKHGIPCRITDRATLTTGVSIPQSSVKDARKAGLIS